MNKKTIPATATFISTLLVAGMIFALDVPISSKVPIMLGVLILMGNLAITMES